MKFLIKDEYINGNPKRLVLHWTAGDRKSTNHDRQFYHFIIDQDLTLVYGHNKIEDNDNTSDGRYAAHCRRANTKTVGVALAGMAGSREKPFVRGTDPITHAQYELGCRVCAEIAYRCNFMGVNHKTIANHGMVEEKWGIDQRNKWDVMVLPWDVSKTWQQVEEHFLERVQYYYGEYRKFNEVVESAAYDYSVTESGINMQVGRVTAYGLNVRTGPSVKYNRIDILYKNAEVLIVGNHEDWFEVKTYDGRIGGWVHGAYLDMVDGIVG